MTIERRLRAIEQKTSGPEVCGCPGGWLVDYHNEGEPEILRPVEVCQRCGAPRGRILVRYVHGLGLGREQDGELEEQYPNV